MNLPIVALQGDGMLPEGRNFVVCCDGMRW